MKSLAISLLAAWSASVRSFVDGNIFRESNIDLLVGDICDRLGYLKNALDAKPNLVGTNTMTGTTTITGTTGGLVVNGDNGTVLTELTVNGTATFTDVTQFSGEIDFNAPVVIGATGQLCEAPVTLADASVTIGTGGVHQRVPTLTANRVYTLPTAAGKGRRVRLERVRTADAFTATLQKPGAVTLGVIPVSQAGFIEAIDGPGGWVVASWSSNITSLDTTV